MWEFFTLVLKADNGGWGLLVAFWILCVAVTKISVTVIKRVKTPKASKED